MDTHLIAALAERVARLERENRRLKRVGIGMAASLAAIIVGGAAAFQQSGDVTVRSLTVLGPNNDRRIVLQAHNDGGATMSIYRANNSQRVVRVGCDPNQNGTLDLWDNQSRTSFRAP